MVVFSLHKLDTLGVTYSYYFLFNTVFFLTSIHAAICKSSKSSPVRTIFYGIHISTINFPMRDTNLSTKENYLEFQRVPEDTQFIKTLPDDTAQSHYFIDEKITENYLRKSIRTSRILTKH